MQTSIEMYECATANIDTVSVKNVRKISSRIWGAFELFIVNMHKGFFKAMRSMCVSASALAIFSVT